MDYDSQGFVTGEDGTRLFYGVRGQGPAIVLNDGIGCDGFAWRYLQPDLAERYRVVHWHYRGHGRSGRPQDPSRIGIPDLARDLVSVLDALHIDKALLFGHSMGTQVALEAYRAAPERVAGLILLCGASGKVTHTFRGTDVLSQVLPGLIDTTHRRRGLARALWSRFPPSLAFRLAKLGGDIDHFAIRKEDFRHYWEHISVMDPEIFLPMLRAAGEHSADDLLPTLDVPTLVIAAEKDTFTPPAVAEAMARKIPSAEFCQLQGARHAAPVEQPMAIQLRIEKFLLERMSPEWNPAREP